MNNERGISIVENLVAITLLSIILASTSRLVILAVEANASRRDFTSVGANVQGLIDNYRAGNYTELLDKFGSSYASIEDGDTVSETQELAFGKASMEIVYQAIKSGPGTYPDAIEIQITVNQRRGKLQNASFQFDSVIAPVS